MSAREQSDVLLGRQLLAEDAGVLFSQDLGLLARACLAVSRLMNAWVSKIALAMGAI